MDLDRLFYALSDPTRRRILHLLAEGKKDATELGLPFAMSKQGISKHLKVLEQADLIRKRKEGRQQFCHLNFKSIAALQKTLAQLQFLWEERFDLLEV